MEDTAEDGPTESIRKERFTRQAVLGSGGDIRALHPDVSRSGHPGIPGSGVHDTTGCSCSRDDLRGLTERNHEGWAFTHHHTDELRQLDRILFDLTIPVGLVLRHLYSDLIDSGGIGNSDLGEDLVG